MKSLIYFIFTLLLSTVLFSCEKDDVHTEDGLSKLEIISPKSETLVDSGTTVTVDAIATAPTTLHGYKIVATNMTDGSEIFNKEAHTHDKTLSIKESFANTALAGQNVKITIMVATDHNQNALTESVTIRTK